MVIIRTLLWHNLTMMFFYAMELRENAIKKSENLRAVLIQISIILNNNRFWWSLNVSSNCFYFLLVFWYVSHPFFCFLSFLSFFLPFMHFCVSWLVLDCCTDWIIFYDKSLSRRNRNSICRNEKAWNGTYATGTSPLYVHINHNIKHK